MLFKVNNILKYALIDAVIWHVCKYDMQIVFMFPEKAF